MTVLKIIGIVLASLVALVIILLFCPVKAELHFSSGTPFSYKVKFLFFTFVSSQKKKKKKSTDKKEQTNSQEKKTTEKKKGGIENTVKLLFSAVKKIAKPLKHIRIDKFRINCVCAGEDAADTAIRYGVICALIYPFAAFVQEKSRSKKPPEISVSTDFDASADNYEIYAKLHTLLIFSAIALAQIAIDYTKKG